MSRHFWGGSLWANFSILRDCKLCGLILQVLHIMTHESVLTTFNWVYKYMIWVYNLGIDGCFYWHGVSTDYNGYCAMMLQLDIQLHQFSLHPFCQRDGMSLLYESGLCLFKLHILSGIDHGFLFDYYQIFYAHMAWWFMISHNVECHWITSRFSPGYWTLHLLYFCAFINHFLKYFNHFYTFSMAIRFITISFL